MIVGENNVLVVDVKSTIIHASNISKCSALEKEHR